MGMCQMVPCLREILLIELHFMLWWVNEYKYLTALECEFSVGIFCKVKPETLDGNQSNPAFLPVTN